MIRHYHGHLSGVYSLSLHPTLDILVTSGRDASARVWDMRTKAQIHALTGHTGTVSDVKCQESDPQVITGSMDSTVRYTYFSKNVVYYAQFFLFRTCKQALGLGSGEDNDNTDAPQKVRPRSGHPSHGILVCLRLSWWQQHQKMEMSGGDFRVQFQWAQRNY